MVWKILVVDDDPELQDLIRSTLARKGYDVLTADDALQGLELIAAEKIDLALLDVMMPGMDGLTMLSQLREHNENLRVIIMSGNNTPIAYPATFHFFALKHDAEAESRNCQRSNSGKDWLCVEIPQRERLPPRSHNSSMICSTSLGLSRVNFALM